MEQFTKEMFAEINRNHDCQALATRLQAISARRKWRGGKKWKRQ